jgi:sugar phosphate permease
MMIQNLIVSLFALMMIIVARDNPPTPPSSSGNTKDKSFSIRKEFKDLIRNKNYLWLGIAYSFVYSNNTALSAVMSSLTSAYGYLANDNAVFGGVYIISGILGTVVVGLILDKF